MFEKILERLLKKYLGNFIDKLDQENLSLGVWSGNFLIENISLKQEIFQMLEIPVNLNYSNIGKLSISVPWAKLSQKPIEITLEQVYILVSPISQQNWSFFDFKNLQFKQETLEKFAKNYISQLQKMQQKDSQKEEKGYLEKLSIKVLDNIQLNIKDIKIRFENQNEICPQQFSIGFQLNQLKIITTNDKWENEFVDRKKSCPMRKLFLLENFDVFWNYENIKLIRDQINLREFFQKDYDAQGKIMSLSAEMKLIQQDGDIKYDEPRYQFFINLKQLDLHMQKMQMQQVIQSIEFFNNYSIQFQKYKISNQIIDQTSLQKFEKQFKDLYQTLMDSLDQKFEDEDDETIFNNILIQVDINILQQWTIPTLKNLAQKQLISQKSRKSVFSYFQQDNNIDEISKIEQFFKNHQEDNSFQNQKDPKEFIWFSLQFNLESGSLKVSQKINYNQESVTIDYKNLKSTLLLRETNTEFILNLKSVQLDLIDENAKTGHKQNSKFLYSNCDTDFLKFKYEICPLKQNQEDYQLDKVIFLNLQEQIIIYNHKIVDRLMQIFFLQTQDSLKLQAYDKLNQTIDEQQVLIQKAIQQPMLIKIDVFVKSPQIYLPISKFEQWHYSSGDLIINTDDRGFKGAKYQRFQVFIDKIQIDFLVDNLPSYILIDNYKMEIEINILKNQYRIENQNEQNLYKENPNILAKALLPAYKLNLTKKIVEKLFQISYQFQSFKQETNQFSKIALMPKARKIGEVYLKYGPNLYDWNKYQLIITNSHLYFFLNSKQKQPEYQYYIRQANVEEQPIFQTLTVYQIQNRYTNITLGWERQDQAVQWIKIINDLNSGNQNQQQIILNPNQIQLMLDFKIQNLTIQLDDENDQEFLVIAAQEVQFNLENTQLETQIQTKIGQIQIQDFIRNYLNQDLNYFMKTDQIQEFIFLQIKIIDKSSQNYKQCDMDINIFFGQILLNFKTETVIKIMQFLNFQTQSTKQEQQLLLNQNSVNKSQSSQGSILINNIKSNINKNLITQQMLIIRKRINFQLKQIKFVIVNSQTYLAQNIINLQESQFIYLSKQYQSEINLELKNLQILDLTNYPNSLFREDQYVQIEERQIFGVSNQSALLTAQIKMVQKEKQIDDVFFIMDLEINNATLNFITQPILRFIDIISIQLFLSFQQEQEPYKFSLEDAQMKLENLNFMMLNININQSEILLQANQIEQNYFLIKFGFIQIKNEVLYSYDRCQSDDIDSIWVQRYNISWQNMQLFKNQKAISYNFHYQMQIEMPMFIPQYSVLYPESYFDNSLNIISRINPINIFISHDDYTDILMLLYFNLQYDDKLDQFFIFKWEQKMQLQFMKIFVQVDIDEINVYLIEKQEWLSRVSFDQFRVQFTKDKTMSHIHLIGKQIQAFYYYKIDNIIYQSSLVGPDFIQSSFYPPEEKFLQNENKYEFQIVSHDNEFDFKVDLKFTGSKIIDLSLKNVTINCQLLQIMKLGVFFKLDQKIYPQTPFDYLEKHNIKYQNVQAKDKIKLKLRIQNANMIVQDNYQKNCLVIRGKLQIIAHRNQCKSEIETVQELKENEMTFGQSYELNQILVIDASVEESEVFISNKQQLYQSFQKAYKQNLLSPFCLLLNIKISQQLLRTHKFIPRYQINLNFDYLDCQINFSSYKMISKIWEYQSQFIQKSNEVSINQEMHLNFHLHKMQFGIINDAQESENILNLEIDEFQIEFHKYRDSSNGNLKMNLYLAYFNPIICRWEPVLESACFEASVHQSEQLMINLQQNKIFNINISTSLLYVLDRAIRLFHNEIDYKMLQQEEQPVQITPFKIQNLTGYQIQIFSGQIINNEQTLNFVLEKDKKATFQHGIFNSQIIKFSINNGKQQQVNLQNINKKILKSQNIVCRLDLIDNKKHLIISSNVIIKNNTNLQLTILIKDQQKLELKSITPIPLDQINSDVKIIFENYESQWMQLQSEQQKWTVKLGQNFLNFERIYSHGVNYVSIDAPFKIINYLPFEIKMFLILEDDRVIQKAYLKTYQKLEIFRVHSQQKLFCAIKIHQYKICQKFSLNQEFIEYFYYNQSLGNIYIDYKILNQVQVCFYLQNYLVNQAQVDLKFIQTNKDDEIMMNNNKFEPLTILNDYPFLIIHYQGHKSQLINTGIIKNQQTQIETHQGILEFTIQPQLIQIDSQIISKQIIVSPKFVLQNSTCYILYVRQANTQQNLHIPQQNSRVPYYWYSNKQEKLIQFSIDDPKSQQIWSGDIQIDQIGQISIVIRHQKQLLFFLVHITINDNIIYVTFQNSQKGQESYMIKNNTFLNIQYSQINQELLTIAGLTQKEFAWDEPSKDKTLFIVFKLFQRYHYLKIDLNQMKQTYRVEETDIVVQITLHNCTKIILIEKANIFNRMFEERQKQTWDKIININFKEVGVSLIQNSGKLTQEFLYIQMNKFEFMIAQNQFSCLYQFRLKNLSLDNNLISNTKYPVLLSAFKENEQTQILNIIIRQNIQAKDAIFYESILLDVQPFSIKLEDDLIIQSNQFIKQINQTLQFKNEFKIKQINSPYEWKISKIQQSGGNIYIDEINISGIKLVITLNCNFQAKKSENDNMIFKTIFQGLGSSIISLDEAQIDLQGIQLRNCFDTKQSLMNKLIIQYRDEFLIQMFLCMGRFDIFGNPAGLFQNIGMGIQDLFIKPKEGFVKGPLEGSIGIIQGAGSLLKNTSYGIMNTVDKMTGSLGSGFAGLSLDDEYVQERYQMKNQKANNIEQGFQQAGLTFLTGIEKGFTGLITKPIEGVQKQGFEGFIKGTTQGIAGLIIKPITGVLDGLSKTAEGFKNQVNDDKPNEHRSRVPRVFYGIEKFYATYNEDDSFSHQLIQKLNNFKYKDKVSFLSSFIILQQNQMTKILIITEEYLIYVNLKSCHQELEIKTSDIKDILMHEQKLVINYKQANKVSLYLKDYQFNYSNLQQQLKIINILKSLRVYHQFKTLGLIFTKLQI